MNKIALDDLKTLLYSEKEWVKVHVAEFLIWENQYVDEVRKVFLEEERQFGHVPKYRVGIWRVLSQSGVDSADRQYWIDKIVSAYQDPTGEDRLHAVETLAKLEIRVVQDLPVELTGSFRLYSLWNYALSSEEAKQAVKHRLIADLEECKMPELEQQVTSYVLRHIGTLSGEEFKSMLQWMQINHFTPSLYSNLLATLLMSSSPDANKYIRDTLKRELLALRFRPEALNNVMKTLAVCGSADDKEIIHDLYEKARDADSGHYNSDLHATACYMVLKAGIK